MTAKKPTKRGAAGKGGNKKKMSCYERKILQLTPIVEDKAQALANLQVGRSPAHNTRGGGGTGASCAG